MKDNFLEVRPVTSAIICIGYIMLAAAVAFNQMTIEDAVEEFKRIRFGRIRKHTKENYSSALNGLVYALPENIPIEDIGAADVMNHINRPRFAVTTRNRMFKQFNAFFRALQNAGHIAVNPMDTVRNIRPCEPERYVPAVYEIMRIMMALPQPFQDVFEIMLNTGARPGEILNNGSDMWFPPKWIPEVSGIRLWRGKTEEFATIPIVNKEVIHIIERHLNSRNEITFNKTLPTFRYHMKKACNKLGIRFTPHYCRHSFATYYYEKTNDILGLKKVLSHKDIKTTERYVHSMSDAIRKNMGKLPFNRKTEKE